MQHILEKSRLNQDKLGIQVISLLLFRKEEYQSLCLQVSCLNIQLKPRVLMHLYAKKGSL